VLKSDPTIAADLLRVANSAEFCMQSRIADVQHAFALIGFERTRSLALTVAMRKYTDGALRRADAYPFWTHSVATAVTEEALAGAEGYPKQVAYTVGLLHDIGRIGLLLTARERYLEILRVGFEHIQAVSDLEQLLFGLMHCEAGAFLMRLWQFPAVLCDCASQHHEELKPGAPDLVRLTKIACRIANSLGFSESAAGSREPAAVLIVSLFGDRSELHTDRLQNLITQRLVSFSF